MTVKIRNEKLKGMSVQTSGSKSWWVTQQSFVSEHEKENDWWKINKCLYKWVTQQMCATEREIKNYNEKSKDCVYSQVWKAWWVTQQTFVTAQHENKN